MNLQALSRLKKARSLTEMAGRDSDPRWFAALGVLPNPDPILRRDPRGHEIFDAIQADAHVMGELRSIKADLLRFEHHLEPGDNSRAGKRAFELCQGVLKRPPAPNMTWLDVIWNIHSADFRGLSAHEVVWGKLDGGILPVALLDRPARRFAFDADNNLRLLTRNNQLLGELVEPGYFLINRHMPTTENPYGVALFSSCFWPYTFKHGGFRWFVKFCERFGIPLPVGKYAPGTPEPSVKALEEALENLIEAGYAALEEGGSIEIVESKSGGGAGKLAQHQLIEACNAEMSKALTSQTLATEQNNGGARAASETHAERAADVNEGGREQVAFTLDQLWAWITERNLGPDVAPPTSEFRTKQSVRKERAEIYKLFTDLGGKPSRKAMAADLDIALANASDADDQMQGAAAAAKPGAPGLTTAEFAAALGAAFPDQVALDAINLDAALQPLIEQLLAPVLEALKDGLPPEALAAQLAELYPQLDDKALQALLARAVFVASVWGRLNAEADDA